MEKYLPKFLKKDEIEKILDQMNHSICKIIKKERNHEIGFFIYINHRNNKIPVLMTKYNIKDTYEDKSLNVIINNKIKKIKLGLTRYLSKEYNIALIEIEENKEDNIKFIDIDYDIYNNVLENNYYKKSIYIIQDNKKDISVSFGIIEGIIKADIKYCCYINSNSKNLPIFDLENNKIIGLHQNKSKLNKGILIKNIIKGFKKILYKNEINLLINIDKNEINKEIYFMDNYDKSHSNLKELNNLNTELYINNNKFKYTKYFIPKNEGKYNIKIKFNINIKDCSYMFSNCKNIEYINLLDFNTDNIINMQYMFYECNIKEIDLISLNTKNVKNMNNMFENCKNLKYLELDFFDINNVIDISEMFKGCSCLKTLPNISKWNTEKINIMKGLFEGCTSLKELPDISKWDMKNIRDISRIFKGCTSLISLPDISKWNIKNVKNINEIFNGCSSLKSLPDLSKWNTENIINISSLFECCSSLKSLPDISKWNIKNIKNMSGIFKSCSAMESLPDV